MHRTVLDLINFLTFFKCLKKYIIQFEKVYNTIEMASSLLKVLLKSNHK